MKDIFVWWIIVLPVVIGQLLLNVIPNKIIGTIIAIILNMISVISFLIYRDHIYSKRKEKENYGK